MVSYRAAQEFCSFTHFIKFDLIYVAHQVSDIKLAANLASRALRYIKEIQILLSRSAFETFGDIIRDRHRSISHLAFQSKISFQSVFFGQDVNIFGKFHRSLPYEQILKTLDLLLFGPVSQTVKPSPLFHLFTFPLFHFDGL